MASTSSRALVVTSNSHSHSDSTQEFPLRPEIIPGITREPQWQPILHASNQVVLYNPHSHALTIASSSTVSAAAVVPRRRQTHDLDSCPYCKQPLPADFPRGTHNEHKGDFSSGWDDDTYERNSPFTDSDETESEHERFADPAYESRVSNYFQLLAIANETSSVVSSPGNQTVSLDDEDLSNPVGQTPNTAAEGAYSGERPMAEGYFKSFFQEEAKLGMGANGTVYLCQHVLDGNPLGHFAVKKIAVGQSHSYLLNILREVRLLERLHHPNIITYHHAWLETAQFSSFGPKVPTLHVLMQWAEGGSLDDFIDVRLGRKLAHIHMHPAFPTAPLSMSNSPQQSPRSEADNTADTPLTRGNRPWVQEVSDNQAQRPAATHAQTSHDDQHSRSARIRAFRAFQRAPPEEKERMRRELEMLDGAASGSTKGKNEWTAVHLLSADEIKSLFTDVVEGLRFLHSKSILHLDLKPGNVLLTWDEGNLIPRAMLSDFGTSRDMLRTSTTRSGNTGTLEYTAPESLPSPQTGFLRQVDSKADMWSLGMILHKLLFFKLPYRYAASGDANGEPVSQTDEGKKMERLENEVLEYPGFKSTPSLVTGFETRRLPRSFLVLLENLLHKAPSGRPSCERVVTAIKEGKFDPLTATTTSSLPIARASSSDSNPQSPKTNDDGQDTYIPSENARLLTLPSSIEVLGPEDDDWKRWLTIDGLKRLITTLWTDWTSNETVSPSGAKKQRKHPSRRKNLSFVLLRGLRSGILVAKVLSIPMVCPDALTRPRPIIAGVLLVAAVVDTMVDYDYEKRRNAPPNRIRLSTWNWQKDRGVWVSVGLVVLHMGVLGLGRFQLLGWDAELASKMSAFWGWTCCLPSSEKVPPPNF